MYIGAGFALIGAALVYGSMSLLGYAAILFLVSHTFIILYEEPTLRRIFGEEYEDYCRKVRRWLPSAQEKGNQHA
jgi:protein-S-isoprenylcysteine O-methyltransferase Ste14